MNPTSLKVPKRGEPEDLKCIVLLYGWRWKDSKGGFQFVNPSGVWEKGPSELWLCIAGSKQERACNQQQEWLLVVYDFHLLSALNLKGNASYFVT